MIANDSSRKQLIDFLIYRWQLIVGFAAVETVYQVSCLFAEENAIPAPSKPLIMIPQACRQIEVIKHYIIEIIPEVGFIDYDYESPAPLSADDFVEMFIEDHYQCISKVKSVIKKMKIN